MKRPGRTNSLRARLLFGTVLTSIIALSLLGLGIDTAVRRLLSTDFDRSLLATTQALASMVEQDRNQVRFEFDQRNLPEFDSRVQEHPAYFQLWVEGKEIARSPSVAGPMFTESNPTSGRAQFTSVELPGHREGREVFLTFQTHLDPDDIGRFKPKTAVLKVARDTQVLNHTLFTIRAIVGASCLAAIAVSAGALLVVVGRAIRPVRKIARGIDALQSDSLSMRIDGAGVPAEIVPIVDRLNDLLARLEGAFEREKSFAADAAHELRTPIAGLRATLEVCLSRPRESQAYVLAVGNSLKVVASLQTLIENLLLLARAENGQLPLDSRQTDIVEVLNDEWTPVSLRASESKIDVQWNLPAQLAILCDAGKLRIMVANIFDNAVSYTEPGGKIRIELLDVGLTLTLRVSNTTSGLTLDDVPHLTRRFWRKDSSRTDSGRHAGLGLSLCQRLATLMSASFEVVFRDGWFEVEVKLPASRHSGGASPSQVVDAIRAKDISHAIAAG